MKKIICKKEYDTETSTLIKKYTSGNLGDPAGYEECLYQTPAGLYRSGNRPVPLMDCGTRKSFSLWQEGWRENKEEFLEKPFRISQGGWVYSKN